MTTGLALLMGLATSSLSMLLFLFWTASKVDEAYEEVKITRRPRHARG